MSGAGFCRGAIRKKGIVEKRGAFAPLFSLRVAGPSLDGDGAGFRQGETRPREDAEPHLQGASLNAETDPVDHGQAPGVVETGAVQGGAGSRCYQK